MMRRHYDFIFAGGGVAGLSLACRLADSPLKDRSILIIDRDAKTQNDRTLCFWADQPTPFDSIVYRSWDRLRFASHALSADIDLPGYRYQMIRGLDFYRAARQHLSVRGNVDFLCGNVERIDDGPTAAAVRLNGQPIYGEWVFDSRINLGKIRAQAQGYHYLQQYFAGRVIETPNAAFDPLTAIFLDFRTSQASGMAFFYVLPLSPRRALVEHVSLVPGNGVSALNRYLRDTLGLTSWRVTAEESGASPLTDAPFPRQIGRRVMTIGTAGGQIKPTSGYAFTRILRDSASIVQSLQTAGHPFAVPGGSAFYRLCDSLMLQVMTEGGDQLAAIFSAMFNRNPIERIFRFLDETASPAENLALMASVPPPPFLQALLKLKVLGQSPDFSAVGARY